MSLKYFDKIFNFIIKKSEAILLLVDTAEDEINQGNEIKALVRVLLVVFLMAIVGSAAIFSIYIVFSKYDLFMKIISGIIATIFFVPIVILLIYTYKRFVGQNIKKKIKEDPAFGKEMRGALREMNKIIVECCDELNKKASVGVKDKGEYGNLWDLIEKFKKLKMEYRIYFDGELNEELSDLLGKFRKTRSKLSIKVIDNEFGIGLDSEYFEFVNQTEKVQDKIAAELRK